MTSKTAILLIDPYNEFLHPKGKLHARIKDSLDKTDTIDNLRKLIRIARERKIPIYYCLHQQSDKYSMGGWNHVNKSQASTKANKIFEIGSFGVEYYEGMEPAFDNGDVVVSKHWGSSSFQNTDLHFQLQQRDIEKVVMAGLVANSCLESTARFAYEFSYNITILHDCTAGFSHDGKVASETLIWPQFADAVVTVDQWVQSL